MALAPGARLGPYEVLSVLGSGGMGEVYRARDPRLRRDVAIKVLPAAFSTDADRLHRFEQEARAAAALNHPNLLAVYDIGTDAGIPFIVSELLEGENLRHHLRAGRIPLRKALDYATQTATGLAAAHDKGIVHRDLKPENLFVTRDGRVKILDFGLAKFTKPEGAGAASEATTLTLATQAGLVMGTVAYMSPEQIRGLPTDHRTDIFSLGIILYELVVGERPFKGATPADRMTATLSSDPCEQAGPMRGVPEGLARVVRHALEKQPQERFQSARDLAFALEAFSSPTEVSGTAPPSTALRPGLGLVLGILVGLGIMAAIAFGGRALLTPVPETSFRQLTFQRGYVLSARFTPDAHTVLYGAAWEGKPTQLFTVHTERAESSAVPLPGADILSISRSGELAVLLNRHFVAGFTTAGTLARASLGAGGPREILEDAQEADWSPQDGELAVVRQFEGSRRLEWPLGRVLLTTTGWFSHPRVSPSGDSVAFFDHTAYGDDSGVVAIADRNGNRRTLSDDWLALNGLAWSPSGDEVWFTGTKNAGRSEMYAVDLAGKLRSVIHVPGALRLLDVARDGRALVAQESQRSITLGVAPGEQSERNLSWTDFSIATDLSRDGRMVLLSEQGGNNQTYGVYLRPTDGSEPTLLGQGLARALSPDGQWALTQTLTSPPELVLVPTGAGEVRRLPRGRLQEYSGVVSWFPDGRRVLVQGREPGGPSRLYVQSIDGAEPVALLPEGVHVDLFYHPISPDGGTIAAFGPDNVLRLYSVSRDHAAMDVPAREPGAGPLAWSRDGQSLYTWRRLDAGHVVVHKVDLKTEQETLVKDLAPKIPGLMQILNLHAAPDMTAYVYSYWQLLSDLYVVDGLR